MKIVTLAFATFFAAFAALGAAQAQTLAGELKANPATAETRDYMSKAAMGDLFEIQSSRLALQRANSQEVKDFADMMVKDHMQATKKLEAAAQEQKITISPPSKLDADHQRTLDQLTKAEGGSFERAYIQAQLQAHQKALDMHRDYAKSGDNPQLKQVAGEIPKVVAQHLERVKAISGGMK